MSIDAWLRQRAGVDGAAGEVLHSPSGAVLLLGAEAVIKAHREGTDGAELAARLRLAAGTAELLSPLDDVPEAGPQNRWVTRWPRVAPLLPEPRTAPWRQAATLLAALHRNRPEASPAHGGPSRLRRSLDRLVTAQHGRIATRELRSAAETVRAVAPALIPTAGRPVTLVHGDWHLGQLGRLGRPGQPGQPGQLGRREGGWLLLDVDDVGHGDPAWDLGRPAGFWAAGLLPDDDWYAFLGAYRSAGGPAVPDSGDPWPALEPVARASVVGAAAAGVTRAIRAGQRLDELDDALVTACARMA